MAVLASRIASASLPKLEASPTPYSSRKQGSKTLAKALAVHLHCSFRHFERGDRRVLSLGPKEKPKQNKTRHEP